MAHNRTPRATSGPAAPKTQPSRGLWIVAGLAGLASLALLVVALLRGGAMLPEVKHPMSIAATCFTVLWAFLAAFSARKTPESARRSWWWAVALLATTAGFTLLSALWSLDPSSSVTEGLVWVGAVGFALAGRQMVGFTTRPVLLLAGALTVLGTALAIVSLAFFWGGAGNWAYTLEGTRLLVGPLGYANAFAALLIVTLAATVATACAAAPLVRQRRASAATVLVAAGLSASAAVQVAAIVLTRSRGALAGLAAAVVLGLLIIGVREIRRAAGARHTTRIVAASLLVVVLLAGVAVFATLEIDSLDLSLQSTEQHRVQLWESAVDTALERPWAGWGAGTFYEAYGPYQIGPPSRFAHNLILQQWVETGIIGCVLLVAALVLFMWPRWRSPWKRTLGDPRLWLWLGAMALLVQNMVDLSLYFPALLWLFFLVAGALARDPESGATGAAPDEPVSPARRHPPGRAHARS